MPPSNAVHSHGRATRLAPTIAVGASVIICLVVYVQITQRSQVAATEIPAAEPPVRSEPQPKAADSEARAVTKPKFRTEPVRGRVIWLAEVLESRFSISTVPEAAENALAILTEHGEVLPLVENLRGRAFRKDKRLRGTDMELLVRRYEKQPVIQILRVHQIKDGRKYELDYWCDICSIVMYETGPCACCQADNQLRLRLVKGDGE